MPPALPPRHKPRGIVAALLFAVLQLRSGGASVSSCDTCRPGKFKSQDSSRSTCTECPAGYFQDLENKTSCKGCPVGWSQRANGMVTCAQCPSGTHTDGAENQTECAACPKNTFSNDTWPVTHCKECPTGYITRSEIRNWCDTCFPGRYNTKELNDTCYACPTGYYQNEYGSTSCNECPAGQSQSNSGSSSCTQCLPGQFSGAQQTTCQECPAGWYQDEAYSTDCKPCGTSHASNTAGRTEKCRACPAGYYTGQHDSLTECKHCKVGFYSSSTGSKTDWPCFACMTRPVFNPGSDLQPSQLRDTGPTSWAYIAEDFVPYIERAPKGQKENKTYRFADEKWHDQMESQPPETAAGCRYCPLPHGKKNCSENCRLLREELFEGSYSDDIGLKRCKLCAAGQYQNKPMSQSCTKCPAGWYQPDEGRVFCKPCRIGKYSSVVGAKSENDCIQCPEKTTTRFEASSSNMLCHCITSCSDSTKCMYNVSKTRLRNASNSCLECPLGANCTHENGLAIEHLKTKPGFWRFSNTTVKYHACDKVQIEGEKFDVCCPDDMCANMTTFVDPNQQCREGYQGPLCSACARDFVRRIRGTGTVCEPCEGHADKGFTGAVITMVVFFAVVFLGSLAFFFRAKPPEKDTLPADTEKRSSIQMSMDAQGRFVSDQILIGRVTAGMSRSGSGLIKSDLDLAADRFKIVLGWMQIFASMTVTFESVKWPVGFSSFSQSLGVAVNLDVFSALDTIGTCTIARPFLEKFVLHMMLPVCIIVAILLGRIPAWLAYRAKDKARCEVQHEKQMKMILTIVMVMYPGCCTRVFQVMTCIRVEPEVEELKVLRADYNVVCGQDHHASFEAAAWVFMFLYVAGVPLFIFFLLLSNRQHLHSPMSSKHAAVLREYGAIYSQYEEPYWWYEVVVLTKKMLLTGAMCIIGAGSTAQILVATLITLFFMLLVLKLAPYTDNADDWLSFLTNLTMLLTLLAGFALITNDSKMSEMTEAQINHLDTALVAINSGVMIALLVSIVFLHPRARRWINGKLKGESTRTEKIIPLRTTQSNKAETNGLREWNAGAIAEKQKSQKGVTL